MAAAAVARCRVVRIECGRRPRVAGGGVRAGEHPHVGSGLVAGLAATDDRRDGGVAGDAEGWRTEAGGAELEATGIDIGRRVTARAVAVERADRDVVTARPADDGDRVTRWRTGEGSSARPVA